MGQSHGGLTTMAFGTLAYPGVRGLVNFAGGLRNDTCVAWEDNLVHAFGNYGKQSRYPSLWFYGDNDSYWPRPLPEKLFAAYTGAGGKARLVDFGTFQGDSHGMFGSRAGLPIWLPEVDASARAWPAQRPRPRLHTGQRIGRCQPGHAMNAFETLAFAQHGAVATVTLNRPDVRNAFNETVIAELTGAFHALATEDSVRAIVLAGHGPASARART